QTLFTGNNVRDILRKQVRDPHTPLKQIGPDVPQAISNIIDKMLAKDPANRYQNASEASADIESFLANRHAAADALANKRQRHAIVAETKKPNYALIGIIGGVTVLAIAIIAAIALSDGGDANGPVVINNNTNGHTNQNTAPSPEEGEAEKKYIEAATKEKLGAANPTLLQQAMSDYKYIVATWPKTNAATKASARLKAIEETYGREILEEQQARAALKEEWDKLSKEINDVLLPAFKIGEALGKIDVFDEKIKAYKRETIRVKLLATLNIELARTHAETTGVEAIRSELNRIAQPTTAMDKLPLEDQVTRYESAIAGAQALIEKIDDERYESDVIRQITEWTSKKELITGQIANIALAKRVEAAKTTRVALDALCARVNKNVRSFAFKAALREIDTFENTDPGLKEYRNSPEFKDAVTTLADLKRQVERERDGLRWLVENWRTGGTAAEVKGDKGLELVFPGAEYVSIFPVDKDVFDEDDPKFRAEESTGSVSKSRKLYAFKSRNIASLEVILGAIRRVNSSFNDELKKAENIENVIGIVALLLELGAEGRQAGDLAEFALAHAGSVDAAKRRQIREFMAYGLVARAKYFEANGDKRSALGDYKRLKEEFADTRAAKGAKG
ncbi:MAG: hypothetical protein L6Q71_03990, partial [Planctomycetes bacterium]|nr:hypothetical protein [Planctomycetota bacterium]